MTSEDGGPLTDEELGGYAQTVSTCTIILKVLQSWWTFKLLDRTVNLDHDQPHSSWRDGVLDSHYVCQTTSCSNLRKLRPPLSGMFGAREYRHSDEVTRETRGVLLPDVKCSRS